MELSIVFRDYWLRINRNSIRFGIDINSVSYASPPIWKLHPCGDIISKLYKPTFHNGHLSCNMSYSGDTTL